MKKILVICGPTATGKTGLGIYLAKKFNGEIISADSRQVYCGMDIGTGKFSKDDKVEKFGRKLRINDVFVNLVNVCDPKDQFSVSDFVRLAGKEISKLWQEAKLPIVIGGTGFYINSLIYGADTLDIPADPKLREKLEGEYEKFGVESLYQKLLALDFKKAVSLNESDRQNPRRLIRAIEIVLTKKPGANKTKFYGKADILEVGLILQKDRLYKLIDERVDKRLEQGMIEEVKYLIKKGVSFSRLDQFGLEYRWIGKFLEGKISKKEMVEGLKRDSHDFARRQIVWFKRDQKIRWFDPKTPNFLKEVENLVGKWLNMAK
jgi:tRNA dimethylallyltransferase